MGKVDFKKWPIIPPLLIKGLGMFFVFFSAHLIIDIIGLGAYGLYSQSLSLLLLFISLASLGFAQSFITKSAGRSDLEKLELYCTQHRVINTNVLLLLPIFAIVLHYIVGNDLKSTLVLCFAFLLVSTQRIRFSYIRTSRLVQFSEVPDMLVRHAIFVALMLMMGIEGTQDLYPMLTVALLGAFVFQALMAPELPVLNFSRPMPLRELKNHIDKNDIKIWLNTSLVQFKEFLEISLVLAIVGTSSGGEYKLLMQFSLAFMAVFNALNVINSFSYAKIIREGEIGILNSKAVKEMKTGILFFLLIFFAYLILSTFYDVFSFFSMPESSANTFYAILLLPLLHILMGPLSQLNIHFRNMDYLNIAQIFKIFLISLVVIPYLLFEEIGLLAFVTWKIFVEIVFIAILSYGLIDKFGYCAPILAKLRRKNCQK